MELTINWVANNISVIGPVVLGLGTAFLVFQVAAHWTQIASAAMGIYTAPHAPGPFSHTHP